MLDPGARVSPSSICTTGPSVFSVAPSSVYVAPTETGARLHLQVACNQHRAALLTEEDRSENDALQFFSSAIRLRRQRTHYRRGTHGPVGRNSGSAGSLPTVETLWPTGTIACCN